MFWPSSAQGTRPYAPPTRQTVCIIVTPSPENGIFCPLCFQFLAHFYPELRGALLTQLLCNQFVPHSLQKTPGVGIPLKNRLMFSRICGLLPPLAPSSLCEGSEPTTRSLVTPPRHWFVAFIPIFEGSAFSDAQLSPCRIMFPCNPFRSNTYEPFCKCSFRKTYRNANSFRSNTYKKRGA
jgi:hypothetical protein